MQNKKSLINIEEENTREKYFDTGVTEPNEILNNNQEDIKI